MKKTSVFILPAIFSIVFFSVSVDAKKVRVNEDGSNDCSASGSTVTCKTHTGREVTYTGCTDSSNGNGWICDGYVIASNGQVTAIAKETLTPGNN